MNAEWMDDALCATTDPDVFNPVKGGPSVYARAVCGRCAVAVQCLEYALEIGPVQGIWAGTSERERRVMKRDAA